MYVPREPDKILSGSWGLVAICVTQPLCPFKVPRRVSPSAMMLLFSQWFRRIEHRVTPQWRSIRGKRKREDEGYVFGTGYEIKKRLLERGEGREEELFSLEIEADTHVWNDVATAILLLLVEGYNFLPSFIGYWRSLLEFNEFWVKTKILALFSGIADTFSYHANEVRNKIC